MTVQPDPVPVRRTRRVGRRLCLAAAGIVVTVLVAGCAIGPDGAAEPDAASYPDVPPIGSPGPAACPPIWEDGAPVATRRGNLVPPGATEALLCVYPFRAPDPMPLGTTHRLDTGVDAVVDILNSAPETRPPGVECLLGGATSYNVVLGYPDRQPALVHVRSCAVDQSGAVRYEIALRQLVELFGARL